MYHIKRAIGGIPNLWKRAVSADLNHVVWEWIGFGLLVVLGYLNTILFFSLV